MSRHVREPQPGEWPVTGPLADLFAAATRAPEPDELAGEDAAVAAFRAHRTHPGRPPARAPLATGVR